MNSPDFLAIGAKKAASTWLYAALSKHDKIWCPPTKELHYFLSKQELDGAKMRAYQSILQGEYKVTAENHWFFNNYLLSQEYSLDWYRSLFPSDKEQVLGDVDPNLCSIPVENIQEIYKCNSKLKIIFVLRNPIQRCWSHFKMTATQSKQDIIKLIGSNDQRLQHIFVRSFYKNLIENWFSVFPREQFLFINFDEIQTTPGTVLESIEAFLGISNQNHKNLQAAVNKSPLGENSIPDNIYSQLEKIFAPHTEYACKILKVNPDQFIY